MICARTNNLCIPCIKRNVAKIWVKKKWYFQRSPSKVNRIQCYPFHIQAEKKFDISKQATITIRNSLIFYTSIWPLLDLAKQQTHISSIYLYSSDHLQCLADTATLGAQKHRIPDTSRCISWNSPYHYRILIAMCVGYNANRSPTFNTSISLHQNYKLLLALNENSSWSSPKTMGSLNGLAQTQVWIRLDQSNMSTPS